jgi:protein-S-isoprenylcysteine O-methyltransferase Ste14
MIKFLWDVVLGRIVPFFVFGLAAVAKGWSAMGEQAAASVSLEAAARFAGDLGTCLFCLLLAMSYFGRLPRLAGKRGPLVVLVALGPFLILLGAIAPHRDDVRLELTGAVLVALGTAYSLTGLAYLRSAFSILPEARALITNGPFALSRHPLYFGEAIATVGILLPLAGARMLLLLPYLLCQWIRMGWEEEVLASQFPDYADYAARVPRYVPFSAVVRRRRDGGADE